MTAPARLCLLLLLLAARPGFAVAITKDKLLNAINQYAPILCLHPKEKYLPTCVESYLKLTRTCEYVDAGDPKRQRRQGLMLKKAGLPDNYDRAVAGGDPANAKAYVNVKADPDTTDLQYWFLYAYNGPGIAYYKELRFSPFKKAEKVGRYYPWGKGDGTLRKGDCSLNPLGVHEGDWEHLTVTLDNRTGRATPEGLYLAAHSEGHHFPMPGSLTRLPGGPRLQVFASLNGHATFLLPPDKQMDRFYHVEVKAGLYEVRLVNEVAKDGTAVDYRNRCEIFGVHGDDALKDALGFKTPAWETDHKGRWGRVVHKESPAPKLPIIKDLVDYILKKAGVYEELTFEAGPYPPWSKSSWEGPE